MTPCSRHISFLTIPSHLQFFSSTTTSPKCTLRSVLSIYILSLNMSSHKGQVVLWIFADRCVRSYVFYIFATIFTTKSADQPGEHSVVSSSKLRNDLVKSIIIILGMPTHFVCHYAERTPDSSHFISKVQSFIIR